MPLRLPPETLKKIQPKLRMIADGDSVVNAIRAERCGALAVANNALLRRVPTTRGAHAVPVRLDELPRRPKTPRLKRVTSDVLANVFVYLRDNESAEIAAGTRPYARRGRIAQVQAKLSDLPKLASEDDVAYVEVAEALKVPAPALAELRPHPPSTP